MDDRPPSSRSAPQFPDRILLGDTRHPRSDEPDPRLELLSDDLADIPTATYVRQAAVVDEGDLSALGRAVKDARRSRGLTQEELAQQVGLHVSYISFIETGQRNPSVRALRRISKALGVPVSELLNED